MQRSDTVDGSSRGGYRPIRLVLTGFRGIRSGLGRETLTLDLDTPNDAPLVAIMPNWFMTASA